tara:strand:- start:18121 stop:19440 length:1320 start_codon:yes stop_codon:yes gene_type:complete
LIFSSIEFIVFWIFAVILSRIKIINSTFFIGIVGILFYSFQGYLNFLILFYVYLICCISVFHKKFLFFHIFLILLPLILIKYSSFILVDIFRIEQNFRFIYSLEIPPGLSFISFSAIALILYLKNNSESNSTKLSYLFFFPQLIAGPIVEPKSLIPQLKNKFVGSIDEILKGIFIFSIGITLKILFADNIGEYIDPIFLNLEQYNLNQKIIAIFLFSQQIFFDFNGYTLMAIGVGVTLGVRLPENFNAPYLSESISDFWKKWHITLSNWIKNYVYIPLGGSRKGITKGYINIFFSMLISGIWHGAGINFLIWGGCHGLIIVLEKMFLKRFLSISPIFLRIIYSYLTVSFLWLFFRLRDFTEVMEFFNNNGDKIINLNLIIVIIFIFILNWFQKYITFDRLSNFYITKNKYVIIPISIILIIACSIISKGTSEKFIYFNF